MIECYANNLYTHDDDDGCIDCLNCYPHSFLHLSRFLFLRGDIISITIHIKKFMYDVDDDDVWIMLKTIIVIIMKRKKLMTNEVWREKNARTYFTRK